MALHLKCKNNLYFAFTLNHSHVFIQAAVVLAKKPLKQPDYNLKRRR